MIKRTLMMVFLASFALMLFPAGQARAEGPTIAIVDVEKILATSKAAQSLQSQLKSKKESFQKEFSDKEKSLKDAQTALLAEQSKLAAADFEKKRKDYEAKVSEARALFQKRRSSLDKGLAAAMKELRDNIVKATADVADEKKYDIVLTREGVMIAEKALDITDSVLTKLDAQITDIKLKVE